MEAINASDTFLSPTPPNGDHEGHDTDNSSKNSPTDLSQPRNSESIHNEEKFYDTHSEILSRPAIADEDDVEQFADTECDSNDSLSTNSTKSQNDFHKASIDGDNNSETEINGSAEVNGITEQKAINNESDNGETRNTSRSGNIMLEEMSSGTDDNDNDAANNEKVNQNNVNKTSVTVENDRAVHGVEMFNEKNDDQADSITAIDKVEKFSDLNDEKNAEQTNSITPIDNVEKFSDLNDDRESIDKIVSDTVANILKNATFSSEDDESPSNVAPKKRLKSRRSSSRITAESESLRINPHTEVETRNGFDSNNEIKAKSTRSRAKTASKKNCDSFTFEKSTSLDDFMSIDACYRCQVVLNRINVEGLGQLTCKQKVTKRTNVRSARKPVAKRYANEDHVEITNDAEANNVEVEKPSYSRGSRKKTTKTGKKLPAVAEQVKDDAAAKTRSASRRGRLQTPQKKLSRVTKFPVTKPNRLSRRREEKISKTDEPPVDEEVIDKKKVAPSRISGRFTKSNKTTSKKSPRNTRKSSISTKAKEPDSKKPTRSSQVLVKQTISSAKRSTRGTKHAVIESEKETDARILSPRKRTAAQPTSQRSKSSRSKSTAKSTVTDNDAVAVALGDRFVTSVLIERMTADRIESYIASLSQASNANAKQTSRAKSAGRTKRKQKSTNDAENVAKYDSDDDSYAKLLKETKRPRVSKSKKDDSNDSDIETISSLASWKKEVSTSESERLSGKSASSKRTIKTKCNFSEKSCPDESNVEIRSKAQKKIYSDCGEVENKPAVKIKIASDESLWEKFIQSGTKTDEKSSKVADNDEELKTKSRESDSDKTNTKSVEEKQFESINLTSSDEEDASCRLNSSGISSKSSERTTCTSATGLKRYSSESEDEKASKNSNDRRKSPKLKPREVKTKSKTKLCDAFSDEELDCDVKRRKRSNSVSSNESDWRVKTAKENDATSSDDSPSSSDKSWKSTSKKSKAKNATKNQSRGKRFHKPSKKEEMLKKMVTLCGLSITSYNKFWGDCETIDEKTRRVHEFLREKGLKDKPSIRSCERFGFAQRGLNLVELGPDRSDDDESDNKHSKSMEEDSSVIL